MTDPLKAWMAAITPPEPKDNEASEQRYLPEAPKKNNERNEIVNAAQGDRKACHPLAAALTPLIERVRTDRTAIKRNGVQAWTREKLTAERLAHHIDGTGPARGVCPIREGESTTRAALLDFDSHKGETPWSAMAETAERVLATLSARGFRAVPFRSSGGRGIHLVMLWDQPQDAYSVRQSLRAALAAVGLSDGAGGVTNGEVEIFPKQDQVPAGGCGNQFILPLAGLSVPLNPLLGLEPMDRAAALALIWSMSDPVPTLERPARASNATEPPEDLERVRRALAALPNDRLPYDRWRDVVFAIHHATGGSDEGLDLALEFSAKCPEKHEPEFLRERVWPYARDREGAVTARTLFHLARQSGWQDLPEADFEDLSGMAAKAEEDGSQPFPEPFPGPMAAMVSATLHASAKPQPGLATLAALVAMAAGCPGAYRLSSGMRLNLYGVGVARTGMGKDTPRAAAAMFARHAGAKLVGKPASGPGLEDALVDDQAMLCEIDEMAHMLGAMNARGAPGHLVELAGNLLKLYSASSGLYTTRVRAAAKGVAPTRTVDHPCFNLLGYATPEKLGEALNTGNIADGLLGRFLVVFGDERVAQRRPKGSLVLPSACREAAERVLQAAAASQLTEDGVIEVQFDAAALRRLDNLMAEFSGAGNANESAFARSLLVRSYEKAERIAGVLAVWDNPAAPLVTLAHVEWAELAVRASDRAVLHFCARFMHEGPVQADAARVRSVVAKIIAGEIVPQRAAESQHIALGWAPWSLALRATKLDGERFSKAIAYLTELGDLRFTQLEAEADRGPTRRTKLLALVGADQ